MPNDLMLKLVIGWGLQVIVILGGVWRYTMRIETRMTRLETRMEVLFNEHRNLCKSPK